MMIKILKLIVDVSLEHAIVKCEKFLLQNAGIFPFLLECEEECVNNLAQQLQLTRIVCKKIL